MSANQIIYLIIYPIVAAALVVMLIAWKREARQRRVQMAKLAQRLGFTFRPDKDFTFANTWSFLAPIGEGRDRYSCNILAGERGGHRVHIFDLHHTRRKNTYGADRTLVLITVEGAVFPQLMIEPHLLGERLFPTFGIETIDLESAEFSRSYRVLSGDRKFAYDVCHPRMLEYFITRPQMWIELNGSVVASTRPYLLPPESIEGDLHELIQIHALLPDYLFTKN
jgi:hypothetical protein